MIAPNEASFELLLFEDDFSPSWIIFDDEPTAGIIGASEIYIPMSSIYYICC
jgi:hypothetical protein